MNTKPTAATGTVSNSELFQFPAVNERVRSASFISGELTSDGASPTCARPTGAWVWPKGLRDPREPERIERIRFAGWRVAPLASSAAPPR